MPFFKAHGTDSNRYSCYVYLFYSISSDMDSRREVWIPEDIVLMPGHTSETGSPIRKPGAPNFAESTAFRPAINTWKESLWQEKKILKKQILEKHLNTIFSVEPICNSDNTEIFAKMNAAVVSSLPFKATKKIFVAAAERCR